MRGKRRDHSASILFTEGGAMSFGETEPSEFHRGEAMSGPPHLAPQVTFERGELDRILGLYGRKVAAGEWRGLAIGFFKDPPGFSVFRRAAGNPLSPIPNNP